MQHIMKLAPMRNNFKGFSKSRSMLGLFIFENSKKAIKMNELVKFRFGADGSNFTQELTAMQSDLNKFIRGASGALTVMGFDSLFANFSRPPGATMPGYLTPPTRTRSPSSSPPSATANGSWITSSKAAPW